MVSRRKDAGAGFRPPKKRRSSCGNYICSRLFLDFCLAFPVQHSDCFVLLSVAGTVQCSFVLIHSRMRWQTA